MKIHRFGSSLGLADLNKDGLVDLVVGEPYAGYHELSYEGGVTILFGRLDGGCRLKFLVSRCTCRCRQLESGGRCKGEMC